MKLNSTNAVFIGLVILLYSFGLNAQDLPIDEKTGKVTFTEVVSLESAPVKDQLYSSARQWFALTFNSANDVLQMDDKESGKLIGKGNISMDRTMYMTDSRVDFTISVFVKEGRYKYTVTDFEHVSYQDGFSGGGLENEKPVCGSMKMVKKGWLQIKGQTNDKVETIIASLKSAMEGSTINEDEEW